MALIKYTDVARNTRGDSLPDYRLQVVTSAGAGVDIYSDGSGTRFRDGSGNVVNYATANSSGKVEFYWTPATGQILQVLDTSGTLVDTDADFADKYVVANLAGEVPQDQVTDLPADLAAKADAAATATALAAKAAVADLASTDGAKGVDLVAGAGKTIATRTAMKALTSAADKARPLQLLEGVPSMRGRMGAFVWNDGDLSDEVGWDTQEGVYIAPDSDATGASGAWVRQFSGLLNVCWFGATGDGSTDDTTAIQVTINVSARLGIRTVYVPCGHYKVTTLYDHYDAANNPGFPSTSQRNGRMRFQGERANDLIQLTGGIYEGTLIETTSATGPAIKLGNGNSADTTTARRADVRDIAFMGTCTDSVVELSGSAQHTKLEDLTIYNKGGASGKALYIHNGCYVATFRNIHVRSDGTSGDGVVCEGASLCMFDTVNVTNCPGTGWKLGTPPTDADDVVLGTGNTFANCQSRNGGNGVELIGGRSNIFSGWWLEKNDADFDFKIHGGASKVILQGMHFTSTELSEGSAVIGGDSGTGYLDNCRGILLEAINFEFCGPSGVPGIKKNGGCEHLKVAHSSFKTNGGYGIMVDTTNGVTPTILEDIDWDPVGAGSAFGTNLKVVDQAGTSSPWLVRGLDIPGTITADLDMSSWTHLPDVLTATTSGGSINVTLPTDMSKVGGQTIAIRKSIGGNTLTITGSINGASSVSVTAANAVPVFLVQLARYAQIA